MSTSASVVDRVAILVFLGFGLMSAAAPTTAGTDDQETARAEGGVMLLDPQSLFDARFSNPNDYRAQVHVVEVTDQPFTKAVQITTHEPTINWWDVQVQMTIGTAVTRGDAVEASFYVRCLDTKDETGEARFRVAFQGSPPEFRKSLVAEFGASRRWRKITCPFTIRESTESGSSWFSFTFPYGPQTLEIGALSLTNYGTTVSFEGMAVSTITYPGQALDAPWREAAQRRIDALRKADLVVSVTEPDGRPVEGARVLVSMTRHAFPFGTAASAKLLEGWRAPDGYEQKYKYTDRDRKEYFYWLRRWFTKAVPAPALMPDGWTGVWPDANREIAMDAVREYHRMGYDVRGHMLVWPGWRWFRIPGVEEAKNDPDTLAQLVIDHVRDETAALKEWIDEWTVLNEPYTHHDIMDVVGNDAMVDWFHAAHEANRDAKLYINDYGILSGGGLDVKHQDHYANTIQFLLDKGAPVHGIGLQGHFGDDPTAPEKVFEILDRFAAFGKEMQITEFDINTIDEQMQADYTRDFVTICFSHPAMVGFSFWGFWARSHWRPNGAMIERDWTLKPNGEAYDKLVRHEWWTEEEGTTNAEGAYTVRGFLGDYRVAVYDGVRRRELLTALKPGTNALAVTLPAEVTAGAKEPDAVL